MNIFKKFYCRSLQFIFKIAIPFLPYREPKILNTNEDIVEVLKSQNKKSILFMTGKHVRASGITSKLEDTLVKNNFSVTIFNDINSNPTTDNVESALEIYHQNNCEAIIAFGGGSIIDCAKAVGARATYPNKPLSKMKGVMKILKRIPLFIAIPTTAGTGTETTVAAVITDSKTRHKYAISSFPLIPHYALLDASLTLKLPESVTASTGMDALTHVVEAYIGRSTTKQTRKYAEEAVKAIFENLETCYNNGSNLTSRENMLIASYKAGLAFTKSYVGYVHSVAHALGGKYNLAHGQTNAIILPYMLKAYGKLVHKKLWKLGVFSGLFNKETSYEEGAKLFISKIEEMNKNMNISASIKEIQTEDIQELAKTAEREANPLYPVPKLFTAKELENIIKQIRRV